MNIEVQRVDPISAGAVRPARISRLMVLANDVVTMSAGTSLAAIFNIVLVFEIPRVVGVEDFGYWRLFMLYGSYAGLLQVGFLDGALLRWAGRNLADFHGEIRPSLKFLTIQLFAITVPAAGVVFWMLHRQLRFVGMAVLAYAILFNINALFQYCLQSARQFRPVALATAIPAGIFVLLTFVWNLRRAPDFRFLIVLYCLAWVCALGYLWFRVKPFRNSRPPESALSMGKSLILIGWPIVLANIGFSLVQSADRLVVSWALPIHDFAQYSLAASAMFVPLTAISATYRVFFSHAAALQNEGRSKVYAHASKFLLLIWSVLLPYFFVLEVVVRHILPKYVVALPIASILLFSVLFLAEIQILHTSFAYIGGRQRDFLYLTAGALALSFCIEIAIASFVGSLVAMAVGQLVALAIWWCVNDWILGATTGRNWTARLTQLALFVWCVIGYEIAMKSSANVGIRILLYYAIVSVCLILTCHPEIKILWRLMSRTGGTLAPTARP